MDRPVVVVEGLRKSYHGATAVDGVSLTVAEGEIFGLIGPNGAGKTTVVECLQGLRHADSGRLSVLGLDPWTETAVLRRRIGSQLQESALPDRIKVWEALDLFSPAGTPRSRWEELLDQWGLAGKRNATFATLSGGQRQRLFVALALVGDPRLVFLDEMTTGLDPAARHTAWRLIRNIRERGTTVVLVTHLMDEAQALCDRVAVMDHGHLVDVGSPQALIARHARVARLTFTLPGDAAIDLAQTAHVTRVARHGAHVEVEGDALMMPFVAARLVAAGNVPDDMVLQHATLEEVFLGLTGSAE